MCKKDEGIVILNSAAHTRRGFPLSKKPSGGRYPPSPVGAQDNIIAWYIANCGVLRNAGNFRMGSSSAGVRDESMHYFNINVVTPLQSPSNAILLFVTGF